MTQMQIGKIKSAPPYSIKDNIKNESQNHHWQMQDKNVRRMILIAAPIWQMSVIEIQNMPLREFIRWWELSDETKN